MTESKRAMNPYLAGALTGVLLALSVLIAGKYFGASTSYVRTVGLIEETVAPEHVSQTDYLMKYLQAAGGIDWQWLFVLGIFFGAFLASNATGSYRWTSLPDRWMDRFGVSPGRRFVMSFLGGAIALFGARMAGGCPSGHGLSGMAQLSVSGALAMAGFFAGGLVMARIIYGGGRR